MEAVIKDDLNQEDGITLMNQLAQIARQLAALAIAEGGNPEKIQEAQRALDAGDLLKASGQAGLIKEAVNKYKDALARAEGAR